MTDLAEGQPVADFECPATGGQTLKLTDFKGKNIVLYFYPKDSTPGCTLEGQNFRDNIEAFNELDTVILGVSRDSLKAHENFKTKQCFPFELLADKDEALCRQFDVVKMKNMYGKQVRGIERSTFLIDRDGKLAHQWRKVKVTDHVKEVLANVRELEANR